MTTSVTSPTEWREKLINRTWKAHGLAEDLITEHSLVLLGEILRDDVIAHVDHLNQGVPTGRVRLTWEETSSWEVEVNEQGTKVWLDVYDVDDEVPDALSEWTVHFWETSPSSLMPYTESGRVETDRTFGMLDEAIFLLDRMLGATP